MAPRYRIAACEIVGRALFFFTERGRKMTRTETPAEHVRNALAILLLAGNTQGGTGVTFDHADLLAATERLHKAVAGLEDGRTPVTSPVPA